MQPIYRVLYNLFRGLPIHPQWLSDRFHRTSSHLLAGINRSLVLDIGSGNRSIAPFLGGENTIYCIDFPDTNSRYTSIPDIYGDACSLPIADESVDVILLLEVLEHVPSADRALKEVHRALKVGGSLYISVPFIYPIHDAPYDFRRFTLHGLRLLLSENKLTPEIEITHGNSFVTAFQLMNLAILEVAKGLEMKNKLLGLLSFVLFYPICLLINIICLPFLFSRSDASCFGYFVVAKRK